VWWGVKVKERNEIRIFGEELEKVAGAGKFVLCTP